MSTVHVKLPERTHTLSPTRQRRFSVAEYHRMIAAGILDEDEHVELIEGEIVRMSPQEPPHARATHRLNRLFVKALSDRYIVRPQLPLTLRDSEPEPDLAIVSAGHEASSPRHPSKALLVVEVANTSLRYDLQVKARVYAKARIPEYWLVIASRKTIEVLRNPDPRRGAYRTRLTATVRETLTPLKLPAVKVGVRSLFA